MASFGFNRAPNRIVARLRQPSHGDGMLLMLRALDGSATCLARDRKQRITCQISNVFPPFEGLLSWLEAAATGVSECATEWDAEGPEVRLEFQRQWLVVRTTEQHRKEPGRPSRERVLDVLVNRRQAVAAIYGAFRAFVSSQDYVPHKFEGSVALAEVASQRINGRLSPDELLGFLAGQDAPMVECFLRWCSPRTWGAYDDPSTSWAPPEAVAMSRVFAGLMEPTEIERALADLDSAFDPCVHRFIPKLWSRMDHSQRIKCLRKTAAYPVGYGYSEPLKALRSARLEGWLADTASALPDRGTRHAHA